MWEKLTSPAKHAIAIAHDEAKRLRNDVVSLEHILLGLLNDENSRAVKALGRMEVSVEEVRGEVLREIPIGNCDLENLSFSEQWKKVFEFSYRESRMLRHTFIGPEHLLLGLLKIGESKAREILNKHGVTYERAKEVIIEMIATIPTNRGKKEPEPPATGYD